MKDSVPPPHEITQLLTEWSNGNQNALDKLYPLVYDELHRMARRYMNRERKGHTLQTTALINEAYVRLVDQKHVHWANRTPSRRRLRSTSQATVLLTHHSLKMTRAMAAGVERNFWFYGDLVEGAL